MAEYGYPPKFPEEGGASYQWNVMRGLGLTDEEIKKFTAPHYWLDYFPPLARNDLQALGCRVST